ncbi:MAG TPA: DUF4437 domain-containing protein [Candidatus Dormibacteraeota bacterium]|nr:DUF4437 domain-containing protein [Candidatus Dormibacteraeota bacterium]
MPHLMGHSAIRVVLLVTGLAAAVGAQSWRIIESRDRGKDLVAWVQPDRLYWRPFAIRGIRDAEIKLLSVDETTQARSQIKRLPPGWSRPTGYHKTNTEIFVLDGDLAIGDKKMGKYSYAHYPAGYAHGPVHTDYGATFLEWWDGPPDFVASRESKPDARSDQVIEGWNYYTARLAKAEDFPKFSNRPLPPDYPIHLKIIRRDPVTGQLTWIAMTPGGGAGSLTAGKRRPLWSANPAWEEGYLLEGDMTVGECLPVGEVVGSYGPGGYFFRPASAPYGGRSLWSSTYSLWLFRTGSSSGLNYFDRCDNPKETEKEGRE